MFRASYASTSRLIAVALVLLALILLAIGSASSRARAATRRALSANPPANCRVRGDEKAGRAALIDIDICRAREGVGPLMLPRNWRALGAAQKLLVLVDLERVNRGLAPVIGLSPMMDRVAHEGAERAADPPTPRGRFMKAGGIWAVSRSALLADLMWMYDDGPANGDGMVNVDCQAASTAGCWDHRRVILMRGSKILGGGGEAYARGTKNFDFESVTGSGARPSFTWARELRKFRRPPAYEPLGRPVLTAATFAASPAAVSANRLTRVELKGHNLLSVRKFLFGSAAATKVRCSSETYCRMTVSVPPADAVVTAVGWGGRARLSF
jgi:hypothetical protein